MQMQCVRIQFDFVITHFGDHCSMICSQLEDEGIYVIKYFIFNQLQPT